MQLKKIESKLREKYVLIDIFSYINVTPGQNYKYMYVHWARSISRRKFQALISESILKVRLEDSQDSVILLSSLNTFQVVLYDF